MGYRSLVEDRSGTFWLPNDVELLFDGKMEDGKLFLKTSNEKFLEQMNFIRNSQWILFHGGSNKNEDMTLKASLLNLHDSNHSVFELILDVFLVLYGKLIDTIEGIQFKAIMINFTNIHKWISPYLITYSTIAKDRSIIEYEINDDYSISFLKRQPIKDKDKATMDRFFNVYVKINSRQGVKSIEEWFNLKQTIQDFLNFMITGKNVEVHSLYGILEGDSRGNEIEIQFKSFITDEMNKCGNIKPVLLRFDLYEDQIPKFLQNWFEFKENSVIYSFYFNYMYELTTFELRVFKLVSFFEAFHQSYVFNKETSLIHKEKVDQKVRILDKLSLVQFDSKDKFYLTSKICDTRLYLKERFMELIEPFVRSIYILNPIYSYVNLEEIKKIDIGIDSELKTKLINIILKKKEIDSMESKAERIQKYQDLVAEINSDHKLKLNFLFLITYITINNFSGVISSYRNIIGHSLRDHSKIDSYKWYYMAKILEYVSQIWILKKIFDLDTIEIEGIYFMEEANPIEMIIESNIQEYNQKKYSKKTSN